MRVMGGEIYAADNLIKQEIKVQNEDIIILPNTSVTVSVSV